MSLVLKQFGHEMLSATLNCASIHSENDMIRSILEDLKVCVLRPTIVTVVVHSSYFSEFFTAITSSSGFHFERTTKTFCACT